MDIINIFSNNNEKSQDILNLLEEKLNRSGYSVNLGYDANAVLNICIGGDGSFLRAVHRTSFCQIPFIGVNTGTLGFFQEVLSSEVDSFIEKFSKGSYKTTRLLLLQGEVSYRNGKSKMMALNEFVLSRSNEGILHADVYVDDNSLENFAGDGLIISTPAGSTAYNYAVGGSILFQELRGYQLAPIAPINTKAYRSLTNSIVLSAGQKLILKPKSPAHLVVDGYIVEENIEEVSLTMPGSYINRLVFDPDWYWTNLKEKFL